MKKIAATACVALTLAAAPALAGGYVPAVDPVVIVEDTSSSSGAILVPIMALIMFAAAASAN
ncbi:hypothetical protein HKCCE2091_21635 [Rhodobacterales bacterium HKCCE2091]|nr:hypothetical protein [Rhodobacterales bacterium HKCCE2091]